jgi:hypothetical protein
MERNIDMAMPTYIRRYMIRLGGFMLAYMVILAAGLSSQRTLATSAPWAPTLVAALTALPICGVFWTIYRLLVEMDDEYQRMLMVKQTLLATALTLSTATFWQFLKVYDVTASGPEWFGVMWLAFWGLAAPMVRWRA